MRALAVIAVILYHLDPNKFIGGYLGVPIFLVLSGYLVSDHMRNTYEENGFYNTNGFYLRRAKKLYPPLIAVLWGSAAYIVLFQRNLLAKLNQIVLTNLLGVYNFWQIANGQSYFERFAANESPFVHLWTMSIEAQFYLLWPLVFWLLYRFVKKDKQKAWLIAILTIASALEMALLFKPGQDTSRIYYGTDTRFFSLGLGALLAFLWPIKRLRKTVTKSSTMILDIAGGVSLLGMLFLVCSHVMDPQKAFAYRGGIFLFSLLTMVAAAVIAHPGSHWNQWLTNPVFDWIGSRSYGIYLYQFPVMIFFEDKVKNLADHVLLYRFIEIIIILAITELSYRWIERPLSHVNWRKTKMYFKKLFSKQTGLLQQRTLAALAAFVLLVGSWGIILAPSVKADNPNHSKLALTIAKNRRQQAKDNEQIMAQRRKQGGAAEVYSGKVYRKAKADAKRHPVNREFEKYGISQVELQVDHRVPLTAIGDSVMAGSSANLKQVMPKALIDAAVSRQLNAAFPLLEKYKSEGVLGKYVLIGLGTNGAFPQGDLDHLMQIVGRKRHVFWINTHVPSRSWQDPVNAMLAKNAVHYKNLTIINWHAEASAHPSWFYSDGTHLNENGSKGYAAFIGKKIADYLLNH